jgi:predicted NAD/FAD-dependent oxidoreductase
MSARFQEFDPIYNGSEDVIPETMLKVIEILAKDLVIEFNQVITQIDYSDPKKVVVKTKEGKVLTANKVIVCVPLPLLRANEIEFLPALP